MDWLSPNPFSYYSVSVYFDEDRLDQEDVERALKKGRGSSRVGSGTDLTTGLRDVEYSFSTRKGAEAAASRVMSTVGDRYSRIEIERRT